MTQQVGLRKNLRKASRFLYMTLVLSFNSYTAQNKMDVKIYKVPPTENHFYISSQNEQNLIPFHNGEGKWGYLNATTDKVVIFPKYIGADLFKNGIAKVYQQNPHPKTYDDRQLTGFIDTRGDEIFPPIFTGIYNVEVKGSQAVTDALSDLRTVYKPDGTFGVISLKTGQWLFTVNKNVRIFFYDHDHIVVDDQLFLYGDKETILPRRLEITNVYFAPNFLRVKDPRGLSGLYSWEGKKIAPADYLDLSINPKTQTIVANALKGGISRDNLKRLEMQDDKYSQDIKVDLLDFNGVKIKSYFSHFQADLIDDQTGSIESAGKTIYFSLKDGHILSQKEKNLETIPGGFVIFSNKEGVGVRSADGQVTIPAIYRDLRYIDPQHIIAQTSDLHYDVFNTQGQKVFKTTFLDFQYLPNLKRFLVTNDKGSGQIDLQGKVIIPMVYTGFSSLALAGMPPYAVAKGNIHGIIDGRGKTIVPFEYNDISDTRIIDSTKVAFFILEKNERVGLMDQNTKWLLPLDYGYISKMDKGSDNAWFALEAFPRSKNLRGLFNSETNALIPPVYNDVIPGKKFLIVANRKDNNYYYRLLDLQGHPMSTADYTKMNPAFDYLLCEKGGKNGVLDVKGKVLIPFDFKYIWAMTDSLIYVQDQNDDTYYMSLSGKAYKDPASNRPL